MNKPPSHLPHPIALAALALACTAALAPASVLFTDNFDIADTGSLDGSDQTGRHTGLIANDIVLRSGGIQHTISGGQLNVLAPGLGRVRFQSAAALPGNALYDFGSGAGAAQMLADGGFRVEFDWTPVNNTSTDWICVNLGYNYFDTGVGVNQPSTDFGMLFRNNGGTQIFDNSVVVGTPSYAAPTVATHHALIDFAFSSFADGSLITATPSVDGIAAGAPVIFDWNGNAGVISLELGANDGTKRLDNLSISTVSVPEPTSLALLGLVGFAAASRPRRSA